MDFTSQNLVCSNDLLDAILGAMTVVPGDPLLDALAIHLSQDPAFSPTPTTLLAALTPGKATFTGYTTAGYTPTESVVLNTGGSSRGIRYDVLAVAVAPTPPDPFVGNSIYGWWLQNGTLFLCGERFPDDSVAQIGSPGDYVALGAIVGLSAFQSL